MGELKRNQLYFVEGRGRIDNEAEASEYDAHMAHLREVPETEEWVVEKEESETEIIDWLINQVSNVAESYGAIPNKIKSEHVHIILDKELEKIRVARKNPYIMGMSGVNGIFIGESGVEGLNGLLRLTHETFHALSSNKILLDQAGQYKNFFRVGVSFDHGTSESLRFSRFNGLNEGITQELTNLFYSRIIRNSELLRPLVEAFDNEHREQEKWTFPESAQARWSVVHLFYDLCCQIKENSENKFANVMEVMEQFFKIYFSGDIKDLKPLLDLIDKRCFNDLAEIDGGDKLESLEQVSRFRKKYGLKEDPDLIRVIRDRKNELK